MEQRGRGQFGGREYEAARDLRDWKDTDRASRTRRPNYTCACADNGQMTGPTLIRGVRLITAIKPASPELTEIGRRCQCTARDVLTLGGDRDVTTWCAPVWYPWRREKQHSAAVMLSLLLIYNYKVVPNLHGLPFSVSSTLWHLSHHSFYKWWTRQVLSLYHSLGTYCYCYTLLLLTLCSGCIPIALHYSNTCKWWAVSSIP